MVKDAVLNIECKLFKEISIGDHTMFIGEIIETNLNKNKEPLAYHKGKLWILNQDIPKPLQHELEKISKIIEKFKKQ